MESPSTTRTPPTVTLEPVNRANFRACVDLTVAPDQEMFVATNVSSIAQAKIEPTWTPFAVRAGDVVVGFAMYGQEVESGNWWIIRAMIAASYQGRGFGHATIAGLIVRLTDHEGAGEIRLGCVLGNDRARRLYERHGFRDTGEIEDNEAVMILRIGQ